VEIIYERYYKISTKIGSEEWVDVFFWYKLPWVFWMKGHYMDFICNLVVGWKLPQITYF